MPSLVAARVSFCHWSRPWWPDISDSERVSVYLHRLAEPAGDRDGRSNSSGVVCSLPPKPPPTSGAMTRILDSGMPVVAASAKRRMCGIWVADHMVICSPVGSTTDGARLHEGRDQPLLAVLPLDDDAVGAGLGDRLLDVAAGAGLGGVEAARTRTCWCRGRGARAPRPRAASLRSSDGRQLVVVDVDELGGVAGLGGACGPRRRRRSRRRTRPGRRRSAGGSGSTWSGVIGQALMHDALDRPRCPRR